MVMKCVNSVCGLNCVVNVAESCNSGNMNCIRQHLKQIAFFEHVGSGVVQAESLSNDFSVLKELIEDNSKKVIELYIKAANVLSHAVNLSHTLSSKINVESK